ncbi:MAG TPA: hypothetical protein VLG50_02025 [Candidatus Saccharimonadales bacterium]|nr:hypothetical protein [Candidatus Saccharimonadales bacterium]
MFTTLGNLIYSSGLIVIGIFLNRFFESKSKLIAYFSHVGAGQVRINNDSPVVPINTHSIVVYNAGRKPAVNVRVGHHPFVRDVQNMVAVFPPQQFRTETVTNAGEEMVFDRILPRRSITITYIYTGLTVNQITAYVRSDEAEAKFLPVTIIRQYSTSILNILRGLVFVGFITVLYYGYFYGKLILTYMNLIH